MVSNFQVVSSCCYLLFNLRIDTDLEKVEKWIWHNTKPNCTLSVTSLWGSWLCIFVFSVVVTHVLISFFMIKNTWLNSSFQKNEIFSFWLNNLLLENQLIIKYYYVCKWNLQITNRQGTSYKDSNKKKRL